MIKIHREIICQSWPLLTSYYSGPIVQCGVIVLAQSHHFLQKLWIFNIVMQEAMSQFQPKKKEKGKLNKKKR